MTLATFVALGAFGALLLGWVGLGIFVLLCAVYGWLCYLGWPRLTALERQMRSAVMLLLVALAAVCLMSALR